MLPVTNTPPTRARQREKPNGPSSALTSSAALTGAGLSPCGHRRTETWVMVPMVGLPGLLFTAAPHSPSLWPQVDGEVEKQWSNRVYRHESQMDAHDFNCKVSTAAAWFWCNPENTVEKKHFHILSIIDCLCGAETEGFRSQRLQVSHVILSMIYL